MARNEGSLGVSITVTDVNEGPEITGPGQPHGVKRVSTKYWTPTAPLTRRMPPPK